MTESNAGGLIRFENALGQVGWQPRLKNGQRLYLLDGLTGERIWIDLGSEPHARWEVYEVVLYRSRKRAERVARREQRRREKEQYREWKEAEQMGVNDD